MISCAWTLYHFFENGYLIYEIKFPDISNEFSAYAINFSAYGNRFPTYEIKFSDHSNWFPIYVNHFSYEIEYNVTGIEFPFDEITFTINKTDFINMNCEIT